MTTLTAPRAVTNAIRIAAARCDITERCLVETMMLSNWGSVRGMFEREFNSTYRGYFPTCGMHYLPEAVIAEVFDALAVQMSDPRRAKRHTQIADAQASSS